MTNADILQLAQAESPELMSKVAAAVAELDAHPFFADQAMVEFQSILAKVGEGLEKNASVAGAVWNAAKNVAQGATGEGAKEVGRHVGGALAAGLGVAIATDLYDAARRNITKGGNLKRILDANPELRQKARTDKEIYTLFDTIHRYAPEMTADPMLGGAIMKSLVGLPKEMLATHIKDLISSQKTIVDNKRNQLGLNPSMMLLKKKKD